MKMNEFMTAIQTYLAALQSNYPDNAESILEILFDAYIDYLQKYDGKMF